MRIWKPLAPPKDIDSRIYEVLRRLNEGSQQTSKSINNITNQITVLGTNPDLTNYFYLPGRATGQFGLGSNQGTYPGAGKCLTLQGYNLFGTNATNNSGRIEVEQSVNIRCANLLVCERIGSFTTGFVVATASVGTGNVNVTATGTLKVKSAAAGSDLFMVDTATGADVGANKNDSTFRRLNTITTGNFAIFESTTAIGSSRTTLSSIRKSDGAWVGPVVASGTDTHLDSIFSIADEATGFTEMFQLSGLSANRFLTVPDASGTIALTDLAQTWSGLQKFPDNLFQIVGSSDATKIVAFEVDGLTTTRTLTVPDLSGTIVLADGAGNVSAPTNGLAYALSTNLTTLTGAASGSLSLLSVSTTGTLGYSSGTLALIAGFNFSPTLTVPSGVTVTAFSPVFTQSQIGTTTGGTMTSYAGGTFITRGPTSGGPTTTNILGVRSSPGNRILACTLMSAFYAYKDTTVTYGTGVAANVSALEVDPTFGRFANATVWSGLRIPVMTGTAPGTSWGINIADTMNNQIAGKLALGGAATPAHMLDLAAGTTTVAPIRMAVATNILTTAVAGCHEYDGSLFYLTHSDAVRTAIPTRRGTVDATAQAAAIGATTLYAAPAAGYYLVHYTIEDTTADITAGTIQFQVNYADDIGGTNQAGAALAMTAVGRDRGSFNIYMAAAGNIQYQTNLVGIVGTAQYALRVRLVHLG